MRLRACFILAACTGVLAAASCSAPSGHEQTYRTVELVPLRCGMNPDDVRQALGGKYEVDIHGPGYYEWWYNDRDLNISFDASDRLIGVSVPRRAARESAQNVNRPPNSVEGEGIEKGSQR
jgi:hypothetical protein